MPTANSSQGAIAQHNQHPQAMRDRGFCLGWMRGDRYVDLMMGDIKYKI